MSEEGSDFGQSAEEIQAFLQKLSRDKRAVAAHLGMHVDRDYTLLAKNERQRAASQKEEQQAT